MGDHLEGIRADNPVEGETRSAESHVVRVNPATNFPNLGHRSRRRQDPADYRLPRVRSVQHPGAGRPGHGQDGGSPPR